MPQEPGVNEDWVGVFDEYGVEFVLLNLQDDSGLVEILRTEPAWQVDLEDGEVVVFVRADVACA